MAEIETNITRLRANMRIVSMEISVQFRTCEIDKRPDLANLVQSAKSQR